MSHRYAGLTPVAPLELIRQVEGGWHNLHCKYFGRGSRTPRLPKRGLRADRAPGRTDACSGAS